MSLCVCVFVCDTCVYVYAHADLRGKGYWSVREEAVRFFSGLQQLESVGEPIPLIQGLLQTCLDLPALRDELYAQTIKQTTLAIAHASANTQGNTLTQPQISTHSHANTLVRANGQASKEPATLVLENTHSLTHQLPQTNGRPHTPIHTHSHTHTLMQSHTHTQSQTRTQVHAHLRYWQLLTCMSCTFLPSSSILKYLQFHLKR